MSILTEKVLIALAVAGLVALFVLGAVVGAAVYGWKAAVRAGNETAAQQNLKTIAAVEIRYYSTHDKNFASIEQLVKEQLLTSRFAGTPAIDGYIFTLRLTPKNAGQPASFTLSA